MPIQGGGDRQMLRPINQSDPNEAKGTHRGQHQALNVRNAQPGMHYYYERRDRPGRVLRRLNEGYEPVRADDPESWGAELPDGVGEMLDGLRAYNDLLLMRIPEEEYRIVRRQQDLLARVQREGTTESFLSRGQERASQLGVRAQGRDVYFQRPAHVTDYEKEE